MLVFLPFAAYLAIFWALRLRGEGWRSSALGAAVCWGTFLALITEILSVPRWITRPGLSLAWFGFVLVSFGYGWTLHRSASSRGEFKGTDERESNAKPLAKIDWLLLSGMGLIVGLVGITAILSAPNTWDAMAYHMSRVVQWMTNRDVNLYPTFYSAQLFLSPWAEYAILHLDVLFGGDRLVNLVEFASMAGTLVGVSVIAERLGASKRGQLLAALACATLPEGVLEASGAMNTYVGAFWIVVTVYYLLRWNERQSLNMGLAIGAAMGLAILTKGTAYLFLPCVILACWWMGPNAARKKLLAYAPVILLVVLVLNGPLYVRNYRLSGSPLGFSSPLGNDPERQYANAHVSPAVTFSSMVKNLSLHVSTPSDAVNGRIHSAILGTFQVLGIDPDDKASTYRGGFHLNRISTHEARASNPFQLALICIAGLLILGRKFGNRNLRFYFFSLVTSFALFCALIRWQPWNSRYHLPLFALGLALVGVVIERAWPRWAVTCVAFLLLVSAVPFALLNSLRPLVPLMSTSILRESRVDSYFADSHQFWIDSYTSTSQFVSAGTCDRVGMDTSLEDFDYPLFELLGAGHRNRKVRYTNVRNLTASFVRPESGPPCVVICLRCANAPAKWAEYQAVGGRVSVFGEVAVFGPDGNMANTEMLHLPGPLQAAAMLEELDRYREAPRSVDLSALDAKVRRASHEWPEKRTDLRARMNALYTGSLSLWRVRDSVDPIRKKGEPLDDSKIDPLQLMAAWEVTTDWDHTIDNKVQQLDGLVEQLNASGKQP
jgi:hypothetical protein